MADTGTAPQYTTFRKTHQRFGPGRICLYDRDGGLPEVVNTPTAKEMKKSKWWLVHFPSRQCAAVKGERAEGERLCQQVKLGVDELEFIPVLGENSHARARSDRSKKGQPAGKTEEAKGEAAAPKKRKRRRKKPAFTEGMSFDDKLTAMFPDEVILDEIDDLLHAEEELVIKGVSCGATPHFQTRFNTLKMLLEHGKGRPVEKPPPPPEKKTVSWDELKTMIFKSPSARMVLHGLIEEAEVLEKNKKAVNPKVEPAAEGAAGA